MCAQSKTSCFSSFIAGQSPEMTNLLAPSPLPHLQKKKKPHKKPKQTTKTHIQRPQQTSKYATSQTHSDI